MTTAAVTTCFKSVSSILRNVCGLAVVFALAAGESFAGGAAQAGPGRSDSQGRQSSAAEIRAHYASRQAALAQTFAETAAVAWPAAYRNTRRTAVLVPTKDQYGDPMYAAYGRRAYAGTPFYNGPAYVSSFGMARDVPYEVMVGGVRQYWSGSQSDPGYVPRTDVNLGVTTGQGYMQHGMQIGPGSIAPSHSRPIQFNGILD